MADESAERVLVLDDVPDNHRSNFRCTRAIAEQLPSNVLYDVKSGCCVHRAHNIVTDSINENSFIGHLHACTFVTSIQSRRNQLHGALRHLVSSELLISSGPPPEFCKQYA